MKRKKIRRKKEFTVIVWRDEGYYIASVAEIHGCHTQAKSLDGLMRNVREVIELCLETDKESYIPMEFIGVHRVEL